MVLVLKTELNGDLRRIPLHNDFLTFDELHLMLCRVYQGRRALSYHIILKYR